jgi:hypothetical protein
MKLELNNLTRDQFITAFMNFMEDGGINFSKDDIDYACDDYLSCSPEERVKEYEYLAGFIGQ